jgi:hypothetical protein
MKPATILLVAGLLAGCVSTPVVETDRDPAADFGRYRTYAWLQEPPIGNPLLKQRVVQAVDGELAGKGWRMAPATDADVLLAGHVAVRDEATLDVFYESNEWSGWNWRGPHPYGTQRVELRTFRVGTLVLDLFDARTQRAVWRGVAEGMVPASEARRERDAMQAVHAMFRDFPPAAAASP